MSAVTLPDPRERKRGTRLLFGGTIAYWTGLLAWTLYTPVTLFQRLKHQSPGHVSLFFDGDFKVKVLVDQQAAYVATTTPLTAAAWIAIPPLLMWLGWITWSARRHKGVVPSEAQHRATSALPPTPYAGDVPARQDKVAEPGREQR